MGVTPTSRRITCPAALAIAVVVGAPSAHAQPAPLALRQTFQEDSAQLVAVLLDAGASRASRESASDRLLALADRAPVAEALSAILQAPTRHEAQDFLLAAIARSIAPPESVYPALESALRRAPDPAPFMHAASAYRTRESIGAILARAGDGESAEARSAACESLAWATGRYEHGADLDRWRDWYASVEWLSEQDWRWILIEGLANNAARLNRERGMLGERLSASLRALYLATPEGPPRHELLASLIADPLDEVRELGMSLAAREIARGHRLEGLVVEAAIALLRDPRASVRAKAASLIDQIAPADRRAQVLDALAAETDPQSAAALLIAASRWPTPALAAPVTHWLGGPPGSRRAAADAALALDDAGLIDASLAETMRQLVRSIPLEALSESEASLVCRIGTSEDRRRVAGALSIPGFPARMAIADHLADDPEFFEPVMSAAADDPALFGAAVLAVHRSRPDARGYELLLGLPVDAESHRERALLELAERFSPVDLVAVASNDPRRRDELLTRLATPMEFGPELSPEELVAREKGLRMLARARLELDRPAAALAALNSLSTSDGEAQDLRVVGWLRLGRVDAALECDGSIDSWLDGLQATVGAPQAREIARIIRTRLDQLSSTQRQRLEQLEARLDVASGPR